jgi:cysteine-rich repeat protein
MQRAIRVCVASVLAFCLAAGTARSHTEKIGLGGKKLMLRTDNGPERQKFLFRAQRDVLFAPTDPVAWGAAVLVVAVGPGGGHTGRIELDPTLWKALGNPAGSSGYAYRDKLGTRGGVTKVLFKPGQLKINAKGPNWPLDPGGPQVAVSVYFEIGGEGEDEYERYCATFGGNVQKSEVGQFKAKNAPKLVTCPDQVCGNDVVELGEECDDGNLDTDDGCNPDCTFGSCIGQSFASTMEAIQAVVFDSPVYGCANMLCHDAVAPQGGLDLTAGNAHANLVNIPAQGSLDFLDLVEPGDKDLSFLYEKLAAATLGTPLNGGSSMPSGGAPPLTQDHLEALRLWIQGGAPETGVVAGTAELLDGCLPDPTPLVIPVPDPPGAGIGAQFQSTPWPLPMQSENEICFATYYDLTTTGLVPASARIPCPQVCTTDPLAPCTDDSECPNGGTCEVVGTPNNPSNECFLYHSQTLLQDPQSHHAFVRIYLGAFDTTHAGWGPWTYKFQDQINPDEGMSCDPLAVDSVVGYNPGCSSAVTESIACTGAGPPDLSNGSIPGGLTGSATTPTFTGAGVPVFEQEFADGVYRALPMQGILVWNSHAFNLTNYDTTMSIYLNMLFADPADQVYLAQPIFEDIAIFVQNVPPFQTREYCRTWTAPQGARISLLTSHTHQWGVRWRTWAPPNTPCSAPANTSCGSPRPDTPLYFSTEYTDPQNLYLDPPLAYDSPNASDRTFLFCSLYDNGSTPTSPPVKRQSTSVIPPLGIPIGGPCSNSQVACLAGPNRGMLCNGNDSACDSFPGGGDGECDACPVRGGVTTTDEMFILQGLYHVEPVP